MRFKKRDDDPATRKLEDEGLLKVYSGKKGRIDKERMEEMGLINYDFWDGVKYMVILSALLWWIPLFGPMVAGYVGGRRTGDPKKGLVASVVSLGMIGIIYYMLSQGILSITLETISSYPAAAVTSAETNSFFGPYIEFVRFYWSAFYTRIVTEVPFGANSYVLTMIFAYVGGIIALENRKEYTWSLIPSLDIKKDDPHVHRYAKNPTYSKRNVSYTSRRSLDDLNPVPSCQASSEIEDIGARDFNDRDEIPSVSEQELQSGSVEHHSVNGGDDWELI